VAIPSIHSTELGVGRELFIAGMFLHRYPVISLKENLLGFDWGTWSIPAGSRAFIRGFPPPYSNSAETPKTPKDPHPFACLLSLHLSVGNKLLSLIFCA